MAVGGRLRTLGNMNIVSGVNKTHNLTPRECRNEHIKHSSHPTEALFFNYRAHQTWPDAVTTTIAGLL